VGRQALDLGSGDQIPFQEAARVLSRHEVRTYEDRRCLLDVVKEQVMGSSSVVILEEDAIRIVPESEGIAFWS
jgi:hypothetical protein